MPHPPEDPPGQSDIKPALEVVPPIPKQIIDIDDVPLRPSDQYRDELKRIERRKEELALELALLEDEERATRHFLERAEQREAATPRPDLSIVQKPKPGE